MKTGKFAFALHESDDFTGVYNSLEDAFADAIDTAKTENEDLDDEEKIDTVYAGELMKFVPKVDAERVIEYMQDKAYDEANECARDYLEDVKKDDYKLLESMLTDAFNEWAKITKNDNTFFIVEDIKERKL